MERETESSSHELLDSFLDRLDRVKASGGQYSARCPAHEDKNPSLHVGWSDHAGVLVHCFSGCSPGSVLAALGLTFKDVRPKGALARKKAAFDRRATELEALMCARRLQAEPGLLAMLRQERGWARPALEKLGVGYDGQRLTLPVFDKDGKLHDVLRYWPWTKRKMIAGEGRTRQPWPSPESVEAADHCLWVVEGEGTAISMASLGLKVVALPGAISRETGSTHRPGKFEGVGWHRSWANRLRRFPFIVCLPDCDDVGRLLMMTVQYDLQRAGHTRNHVVDLGRSGGYDAGDFLKVARTGTTRRHAKALLHGLVATYRGQLDQVDVAQKLLHDFELYHGAETVAPVPQVRTAALDWTT